MINSEEFTAMHWLMDIVQNVDAGLLVLNREYEIEAWNGFMENHSGLMAEQVRGKNIFNVFPEIDKKWFLQKAEPVFILNNRAFTTWEQHTKLFHFKNYHPITGIVDYMYQNITISPIKSVRGVTDKISIIVYDVTTVAVNKLLLAEANQKLERLAQRDSLSGLNNRRHWETLIENEFLRCKRSKINASLLIIDIDDFKQINDNFGHSCGDSVIRDVSNQIRSCQRETDYSGRYGGEEFAIILPDTSVQQALNLAERLRKQIEEQSFMINGEQQSVTISLGLAEFNPEFKDHIEWINAADSAMYESKKQGKNKVTINKQQNS